MTKSDKWWDSWDTRGIAVIQTLASEYDESHLNHDRYLAMFDAITHRDYTAMVDHVEAWETHLAELRLRCEARP